MSRIKVFKLLGEGKTQVEIAKILGCSQANVSMMLKRTKFCPNCGCVLNEKGVK